MKIRKALAQDAEKIAECLFLAMEDIVYKFTGTTDRARGMWFMNSLVSGEANQYSYQNCWITEEKGEILAAACLYDGAYLRELREPVAGFVRENFRIDFNPEDETGPGEIYLDTFGVLPPYQGRGIGKNLLQFLIDYYVNNGGKVIGLLVDKDNPGAKKLYLRLGFTEVGEKLLAGKQMEHLQVRNLYVGNPEV